MISKNILSKEFAPLLAKIDTLLENGKAVIAIEGGSASGKTTLASHLSQIYDATVFHMDDFFLTPMMRTEERLCEVGGNVDRERFENEVLIPLSQNKNVSYKSFDCSKQDFNEPVLITPKSLIIIEGAYSMHPQLQKYYDFSVFLEIDAEKQKSRILKRNTKELANRFFTEWIPLENIYFEKMDIKNKCDLIINI